MKMTLKKIAASVMAAATLAVGAAGMTASAATVYGSYGTFTWSTRSAQTKNTTGTSRLVTASVTVYRDSTGAYVTTSSGSNSGGNGTTASASVSSATYPSSSYNFKLYGAVYGSTSSNSGVVESWTKYAD